VLVVNTKGEVLVNPSSTSVVPKICDTTSSNQMPPFESIACASRIAVGRAVSTRTSLSFVPVVEYFAGRRGAAPL